MAMMMMTMMSPSTAEDRWHPDCSCGWHCRQTWWWEEGKRWCWASLLCKWVGKRGLEEALLALMMTVMTSVRVQLLICWVELTEMFVMMLVTPGTGGYEVILLKRWWHKNKDSKQTQWSKIEPAPGFQLHAGDGGSACEGPCLTFCLWWCY